MDKLKKLFIPHHSTADWNHVYTPTSPVPTWVLRSDLFVSPPSSIYMSIPPYRNLACYQAMLCKYTPTLDLKQGRVITYHLQTGTIPTYRQHGIFYGCNDTLSRFRFMRFYEWGAWKYGRVTWWETYDPQNNPKLRVLSERWTGTQWLTSADRYEDKLTETLNRCGIGQWTTASDSTYCLFDDTEIWAAP